MLELNRLYNLDCMQGMREFPDGFFDLAIVDPPYGIGIDGQRKRVCRNPKHNRKEHSREGWDSKPPTEEYFRELERVSRNQVIWGGNYFVPMLKQAHKGWLIWDKGATRAFNVRLRTCLYQFRHADTDFYLEPR